MKPWNAVVADLGDGRRFVVGRHKIEEDWARFQQEVEPMSWGHAMERARDPETTDQITDWAREQWDARDYASGGTPISMPGYEQMLAGPDPTELTIKFVKL